MAKKKTKRIVRLTSAAYGRAGEGKSWFHGSSMAELLGPDLRNLYFGHSIDVPVEFADRALAQAKSLKLRGKLAEQFVALACTAYREGFRKGEDQAAQRAEQTRMGQQRSNERQVRAMNRKVAEAISALSDVIRNNEVAGSGYPSGGE